LSKLPIPDIMERDIYAITPERLLAHGVRFLFLDVDNTLMPYGDNNCPPVLIEWVKSMKTGGLELFILSNNKGDRPSIFAEALELDFVNLAKKPNTKKLFEICENRGLKKSECALIGDLIYTDVLCAKRAGMLAILVHPIRFSNPFLALRYGAELPFRLWGRIRIQKGE